MVQSDVFPQAPRPGRQKRARLVLTFACHTSGSYTVCTLSFNCTDRLIPTCMYILRNFQVAFQFVLKSERSREFNTTKMTEKERKNPTPRGAQSSSRRVVRYGDEPGGDDEAYQAINVDMSTVQGAAILMAAAALRISGNPENQGIRLWGQLAFGEL